METLRMQGHTIDVVCRQRAGYARRERAEHGTIWRLPALPGRGGPFLYLAQYASFMVLATIWTSLLHVRRRYDLVQVHSLPDTLVFAAWLPRLLGVPVILDLQETMPEFFATKFGLDLSDRWVRMVGLFEKLSARFATHVLTCTDQMRDAFVARGTPSEKITVILNSADESIFVPRHRQPNSDPSHFVVVCHGTIEERYGHEEVVRAVGLLRDEIPGLRLRIYGEGAHLAAIRSLVSSLGVEDRVWFSDGFAPLDELLDGIAGADLGVVAMRRDAFRDLTHCNKMFDFISMKVPAAVSRTRSVEEYFDEDCFELFESGDAADLARAIRKLWLDPDRRAQLVEHASAVNEPYRWPRQREIYRETVDDVFDGRQTSGSEGLQGNSYAQSAHSVEAAVGSLYVENTPASFWKLLTPEPTEDEWTEAIAHCSWVLPTTASAQGRDLSALLQAVLGEGQFGQGHWKLSLAKRTYIDLKPFIPRRIIAILRRMYGRQYAGAGDLGWPFEGRYADFLQAVLEHVLRQRGLDTAEHVSLWPDDSAFAFVLTHDVEQRVGHDFVPEVGSLEEHYGFRSSFNFVPERYVTDPTLVANLKERGFEVGVHDLTHDGKLFRSRSLFRARARRINAAVARTGAAGFRAGMTHRNPQWMQDLDIEYDLSFFDTDPYEPIPGGTMTLWPFILGRFVELPYTLVQDYTLTHVLGERSPQLWLDKVDFIARRGGMALLNTHPDYLRSPRTWAVYEAFLAAMAERRDAWHALPRDVARWWRVRSETKPGDIPPGGRRAVFRLEDREPKPERQAMLAGVSG
jgi:glycosyltransferase involved in cell wall biosynthesis